MGGGSSINGMTWTRGSVAQYDSWSSLLETSEASVGWNWKGLWSYMRKAEGFTPPNAALRAKGATSILPYHGLVGPLKAGFPDSMFGGPQQPAFISAMTNLTNIKYSKDVNGGEPNCVSITPSVCTFYFDDMLASV